MQVIENHVLAREDISPPGTFIGRHDNHGTGVGDWLDGSYLQKGDVLDVEWPDGHRHSVTIDMVEMHMFFEDGKYQLPISPCARATVLYHGQKIPVYLRGLTAQYVSQAPETTD